MSIQNGAKIALSALPREKAIAEIENRFRTNLIIAQQSLNEYVQNAIDKKIIDVTTAIMLGAIMPTIEEYLKSKTGSFLIENFIYSSFSDSDRKESAEFKTRKFPEYWLLLSQLPTLTEYKKESEQTTPVKPLSKEAEEFFITKLKVVFPLVERFQDVISMLYQHTSPTGQPFVPLIQKKFIAMIFRSFAVLSIKYINLKRNPKIENGKIIVNEQNGKIQYLKTPNADNHYLANISIKNAMEKFGLSLSDLIE